MKTSRHLIGDIIYKTLLVNISQNIKYDIFIKTIFENLLMTIIKYNYIEHT